MAAKNKRAPDVQDVFGLHIRASQQRDLLLAEARALQISGKMGEARKVFAQAESIQARLQALESECRTPNKSRDKRFAKDV